MQLFEKGFLIGDNYTDNPKQRNDRHHENNWISLRIEFTEKKKIPKIPGQGVKELVKKYFELVKGQLEQVRIFNAARFFNQFWNTKLLSKRS